MTALPQILAGLRLQRNAPPPGSSPWTEPRPWPWRHGPHDGAPLSPLDVTLPFGPNLLVWTGCRHLLALELKDDAPKTDPIFRHAV